MNTFLRDTDQKRSLSHSSGDSLDMYLLPAASGAELSESEEKRSGKIPAPLNIYVYICCPC